MAEEESDGESEEEGEEQGLVEWVRKGLVRVTVDEPTRLPDILTVSLHLPATPGEIACHLEGVTVMAADRQFIVLCTGPKLHGFSSSGHFLFYDTKEDELHLAPPIDWDDEYTEIFGLVPAIMATASFTFVLSMVLLSRRT
ncbi:hypothetical protein BAE44_0020972 [Dichanthelium oligosanthes]|uniref:Uncharacterized protein n=1 Tax=Dichanthelium oligosanthes TaxID=888268 RepID=A0A1E5UYV2_9POAL|nr:hypothetical protein BAE44_0020972 [Dichanthelium oligosanthes]